MHPINEFYVKQIANDRVNTPIVPPFAPGKYITGLYISGLERSSQGQGERGVVLIKQI